MEQYHNLLRRRALQESVAGNHTAAISSSNSTGNNDFSGRSYSSTSYNGGLYTSTPASFHIGSGNSTVRSNDGSTTKATDLANNAGFVIVIAFIIFSVGCILNSILTPTSRSDEDDHDNDEYLAQQHQDQHRRRSGGAHRPRFDPEKRKAQIDHSLTVKRITEIDEHGVLTFGSSRKSCRDCSADPHHPAHSRKSTDEEAGGSSSSSNQTIDEEEDPSMCAICLSGFEVGDDVAWSRPLHHGDEPACRHVVRSTYTR